MGYLTQNCCLLRFRISLQYVGIRYISIANRVLFTAADRKVLGRFPGTYR